MKVWWSEEALRLFKLFFFFFFFFPPHNPTQDSQKFAATKFSGCCCSNRTLIWSTFLLLLFKDMETQIRSFCFFWSEKRSQNQSWSSFALQRFFIQAFWGSVRVGVGGCSMKENLCSQISGLFRD